MKKIWICAFLVATLGVYAKAQAPDDPDEYGSFYSYENFDDLLKKIKEENDKPNEKSDTENDLKVEKEIQQFIDANDQNVEQNDSIEELKDSIDNLDDYQFEDNRDEDNEQKKDNYDIDGNFKVSDDTEKVENGKENDDAGNRPEPDDHKAANGKDDYALLWGDDSVAPLPLPEELEEVEDKDILEEARKILEEKGSDDFEEDIKPVPENPKVVEDKAILEEARKILEEEGADNFEEDIKKEIEEVDIKTIEQQNIEQIIDETKQLLAESDDSFDNDGNNDLGKDAEETADNNEKLSKDTASEEDTVGKVYADLNADLDKLFETLDKLRDDGSHSEVEDVDKPLEEADDFFDDDDNVEDSEELDVDEKSDIDLDKLLENILSDIKAEDNAAEDLRPIGNDALNEPNPDDVIVKDVESLDSKLEPILYINDALVDTELKEAESVENNDENGDANASVEGKDVKTALVDNLTSAEMDDLVSQFSVLHSEDLNVHSDSFQRDTIPKRITLKVDVPTIITSPNYPNPYPTNSIVDWIIEGIGEGVELNVTEFAVNGALGDYLLVKPGGVDDSGHEGLLFTYRLRTERRYRFTDVDRVFMRFESKPGMQFFRGFVISAKMIAPLSEGPEPIPEPEAVVTPPHSTTTLTLAVSVPYFRDVKEDFRLILADMAEEYIRDNDVDPGQNSTSEVTQITNVGLCPISWPGYERCVAVTFGIALVYEEEGDLRLNAQELQDMWNTYASRDPFALRLDQLAITEFYPPDSSALTAWLVIAAGVVISMMMLAFVLWRFSCFEDYTRMKAYSDTDSIHEKRNLDLYPTPHQTLPPLYAENEYKWHDQDSARVDMGGLANRSYARDNMYDFESDEEVITTRDRNGAVSSRDISNV